MRGVGVKYIIYFDETGFSPFEYWVCSLQDKMLQHRIAARVSRVLEGNFGDFKNLHNGIYEMKMSFGGGIRIYFAIHKKEVVLLLCGGNKSSQARDIKKAEQLWTKFLEGQYES